MNKKNKKTVLFTAWIGILVLLSVGLWFMNRTPGPDNTPPPTPPPPPGDVLKSAWPTILRTAASPPYGNAGARYTMVEFGDFQCPQCGKMEPEIFGFIEKNQNQVNLYFVHRPFALIHKWAIGASETAQIAAKYGKFWPMYQILYKNQDNLEPGFMSTYANQVGISTANFNKDWAPHTYLAQINASSRFCDKLGVISTPTICLRDNKTGVITTAVGRPDIQKLLKSLIWAKPGSDVPAPVTASPG